MFKVFALNHVFFKAVFVAQFCQCYSEFLFFDLSKPLFFIVFVCQCCSEFLFFDLSKSLFLLLCCVLAFQKKMVFKCCSCLFLTSPMSLRKLFYWIKTAFFHWRMMEFIRNCQIAFYAKIKNKGILKRRGKLKGILCWRRFYRNNVTKLRAYRTLVKGVGNIFFGKNNFRLF